MIDYRAMQVATLPTPVGVYALCDLDEVPLYVGQSTQGVRARVQRHLTSARSDQIANRQIDVWEVAYVWAWLIDKPNIAALEGHLYHKFNADSPLMNGTVPADPGTIEFAVPPEDAVQMIPDEEIALRRRPDQRLPRQALHYERLLDQILQVKDSVGLRRSMVAHFARLSRYHTQFLEPPGD